MEEEFELSSREWHVGTLLDDSVCEDLAVHLILVLESLHDNGNQNRGVHIGTLDK